MACIDLTGRDCIVVGGGNVGLEKARGLLECGARVTVTAPEIVPELLDLPVEWIEGRYASWDLGGKWLAIAATPDRRGNLRGQEDAQRGWSSSVVAMRSSTTGSWLPSSWPRLPQTRSRFRATASTRSRSTLC